MSRVPRWMPTFRRCVISARLFASYVGRNGAKIVVESSQIGNYSGGKGLVELRIQYRLMQDE